MNAEMFEQLSSEHKLHLQVAHDRRNQMEIDFGAVTFNDPLTHNVTVEHDQDGTVIEQYGPASIILQLL